MLSPPETIKNDIVKIKRELNAISDIGERNINSSAHITLVDKLTDDVLFPDTIEVCVDDRKYFSISVTGWGYFDHGHSVTVYLKVLQPEPIVKIIADVKSSARLPHIGLAKKISHQTFHKLKPYLENLNYTARWICTEVIVLKKLMSEKHLGFEDKFIMPLQP